MSINSKPVVVLLSRSIRLVSMLQAAAGSQAPLARTLPSPAGYALVRGSSSSAFSRSNRLSFSSSFAAGRGGRRGGSASSASSFSASSSSSSSSFAAAAPRPPPEGTLITSPSNPFVKYCAKLRTSPTERSEAGATLLAGSTIISEVCGGGGGGGGSGSGGGGGSIAEEERRRRQQRRPPLAPRVLFLAPDAEAPAGVPRALLTLRAPAEVLAKLAGLATTARGGTSLRAVAVVDLPREADLLLLALDGVQDPGNVGTLARAALALGWDGLYCLPGTADPWGDKAARAARGAAWRLPVRGGASSSSRGGGSGGSGGGASWGELLEVARAAGLDFMVAEPREGEEGEGGWDEKKPPDASSSKKKNPKERGAGAGGGVCLVLGSEGSGLSAEGRAALASYSSRGGGGGGKVSSVSIPMAGEMESLNVATAGAVLMFALSEGAGDFVRGLEER